MTVVRRFLIMVAGVTVAAGVSAGARAQQPGNLPQATTNIPAWTFNFAPYLWTPNINVGLSYNLPGGVGARLPTDATIGPGDYLSGLHFAAQFAAEARNDRFSLLTDFVYLDSSVGNTHFKEIDFPGQIPELIPRSVQFSNTLNLKAVIWTQSAGYTVLQGDWGNLDLLAGFRYLHVYSRSNYSLGVTFTAPGGNSVLSAGVGFVDGADDIWNGIAGFRGRIRIGQSGFFIPYYSDIGAGGSHLTWQIASGLGYQTGRVGVSVTYRYMSFQEPSTSVVRHINLGGPMLMANIRF